MLHPVRLQPLPAKHHLTAILLLIGVGIDYLLIRAGGRLALRSATTRTAGRRRKLFETKAQRGWFLVVLLVIFVIGGSSLTTWANEDADRKAARRAEEIRKSLQGQTPERLQTAASPMCSERSACLAGRTSLLARARPLRCQDAGQGAPPVPCIYVHLDATGHVTTRIRKTRCLG